MAKIKVHILNFHNPFFSHIEIMLENTSIEPHRFYNINRWCRELPLFWGKEEPEHRERAGSIYSFDIEADPRQIIDEWHDYWHKTQWNATIGGYNCAQATQWFLHRFANIPAPSLSNVSLNYLSLGIMWPSFIPSPATLPGRIMSNAKFHIEARNNPEQFSQYTQLYLKINMALAVLAFSASVLGLVMAATVLTGGIAGLAIAAGSAAAFASSAGFFKNYNLWSAKNISENLENKLSPT